MKQIKILEFQLMNSFSCSKKKKKSKLNVKRKILITCNFEKWRIKAMIKLVNANEKDKFKIVSSLNEIFSISPKSC